MSITLDVIVYEPSESTEPDKYMAEAPALPGCRAWGDTREETLETLKEVAAAFIQSYREHGDQLPASVEASSIGSSKHQVEVLV